MDIDASAEPQSLLSWAYMALGSIYLALLLLLGLASFALTLIVVTRGKGGMAPTALLLIIPIPFLIGIFAAFQGTIHAFTVIATSGSTPKASEIAHGVSMALVAPLVGLLSMVPGYGVAVLGSLFRLLQTAKDSSQGD